MERFILTLIALVLAGVLYLNAEAATPPPAPRPLQSVIDWRRNPTTNLEPPGGWVNQYRVSPSTVISISVPTAVASGTSYVAYRISPVLTVTGGLGLFAIRNNGEGTAPTGTVTDGTAWERNRLGGYLDPSATAAAARWVAFENLSSEAVEFSVTFENMITQP